MYKFLNNVKKIYPLLVLVGVYSIIAFYNLGNTQSPQTVWTGEGPAIVDFGKIQYISRFQFMTGARYVPFVLYTSKDGSDWNFAINIDEPHVFAWGERHIGIYAKYAQIIPFFYGVRLQEVAFRDRYDQTLIPYRLFEIESKGAEMLFDEQHLVPTQGSFLNSFYFDEIYHARTGYEFLHGLTVFETTHPPMGKNFIALSIRTFGMTPFGWRLPGVLAGIMMIPLMYTFGLMMFKSRFWGMFTALIFTFDFMPFVQTRIATLDGYLTLFVIASYLCMYIYVRDIEERPLWKALLWLTGSGLFIGLAIASKWQGFYAAIGLPFIFFPAWWLLYKRDRKMAWVTFSMCFLIFIAVPGIIYLLSYIPFVRAMDTGGGFWGTVIANQQDMFLFHSQLLAGHPFASRWWEWPLLIRPVFYYTNVISDTMRQGISSFGNPAIWWTGIFATAYAIITFKNMEYKKRQIIAFLLIAYAAQFVPWIFVSRATFIYHYFPSIPFVVLLITFFFKKYVATKYPRLVWAYATLTVGLFAFFYPVLSGFPVSIEFVHIFLRWLPAWVLA